jgi:Na+-transporting methylmalonyl-CoA/oxaloacetate decarboxylase gamma subunit
MAPSRPQPNPPRKIKFRPLPGKKAKPKSLFEEHYYAILLGVFGFVTIFLKAVGMSFRDALLTGLLLAAIVFMGTQVMRYYKERSNPQAKVKAAAKRPPLDNKVPPTTPGTNAKTTLAAKQFARRYPPPSPFIKRPK